MQMIAERGGYEAGEISRALDDTGVRKVVQNLVRKGTLKLVDGETQQVVLKREMSLIGREGDNAKNADLVDGVEPETTEL